MSEVYHEGYEASAREIASTVFKRGNALQVIPPELLPFVEGLMIDVAEESILFGEAVAELPDDQPTRLESYYQGYADAIEDLGV